MCELGAVDDPDGVPYAVATTVGAQIGPGDTATEAVTAWLAGRRVLLVVDNCEHVIDAAAALVQAIQQSCPTVSMLATSREGLSLDGEHQWPVRSLEPELEGVQLFCDRAVAADVSFTASSADLAQIVRICRRVDGIPLAIELAAARVRSLNPVDLAERLDDRFRLLRGARRGGIERHQTMHATVQWSYRLLEDDQRALFDRLCVFSGGFDLQAAESVCADASVDAADVVDLLAALVDKSMVIVDRSAPHVRYRLLETLRQFGEEQLADTDLARVRDAHGAYYVAVATDADARFSGEDWDGGAAVFATEWDNLRAGVGWALIKGYLDLARQLVEATSWYGVLKLRYEHHDWANQTLTLAADSDRPAPTAVAGVSGWWYANKNQPAPVLDLAESGLRAAPTRHARSTNWCWHATCIAHRHAEDRNKYEQALAAWNKANQDPRDRFHRMLRASYQAWWGTPEQTAQALTMAESLQRECPNPSLDVWTFWIQGMAEASLGHTEQALEAYHHCLELAQATGHHVMESTAALFTGRALLNAGDGIRVREERLILDTARQHRMSIGSTLTHFAQRLLANGYVEPAAVLLGHVHNRYEDSPFLRIEPTLQEINCETGSSGWVAQGESLDTQEAFTYALAVLDDISST